MTKWSLSVVAAALGILLIGAVAPSVRADEISAIAGGTVVAIPAVNYFGSGPQTVATGITWSSTNASNQGGSVFGYTGGYGFEGNGEWTGALGPMVGLNDSTAAYGVTDSMTFAFATPVAQVGGFLNYVPGDDTPTTVSVYNASHTLLDSYNLSFLTSGGDDSGQFVGFSELTSDISYFTLTDNYVALTDLTYAGPAAISNTPEASSSLLLGMGLLGLFGFSKRKLLLS